MQIPKVTRREMMLKKKKKTKTLFLIKEKKNPTKVLKGQTESQPSRPLRRLLYYSMSTKKKKGGHGKMSDLSTRLKK